MPEPAAPPASNEPDWNWLQDLLQEGSPAEPSRNRAGGTDDTEYFPGRGLAPNTSDDQLLRTVSEISEPTGARS
jgi:hypothetical protein